jgi:hypothetical protein
LTGELRPFGPAGLSVDAIGCVLEVPVELEGLMTRIVTIVDPERDAERIEEACADADRQHGRLVVIYPVLLAANDPAFWTLTSQQIRLDKLLVGCRASWPHVPISTEVLVDSEPGSLQRRTAGLERRLESRRTRTETHPLPVSQGQ